MDTKRTLGFDLPARSAGSRSSFLANSKQVEIWISDLPFANLGETSRQVFTKLMEFNRLEIPNNTRLKIAELFQQPVEYVTTNLRKYYLDLPLPLSEKNRKIAALNRELQSELAISYQIITQNIIAGRPGILERKMLVTCIFRTINALLAVIYHSVLVYDAYPEGVWRLIHRLYAYSVHNKLHNIHVKNGKKSRRNSSINEVYKQLLIFAVSSPSSYRQSDIQQIFNALPRWSQFANLTLADRSPSYFSGMFITQLNTDLPPIYKKLWRKNITSPYILLNTNDLVLYLQEHYETEEIGENEYSHTSSSPLSKALVKKLINVFNVVQHRRFSRTRLNFELQVATGLTILHTLLSAPSKSEKAMMHQPYSTPAWINNQFHNGGVTHPRQLFNEHDLTLCDYDDPMQQQPMQQASILSSHLSRTIIKATPTPDWVKQAQESWNKTFACKTINESAGGYCIDWGLDNAPKIKIGEIVGFRSELASDQYCIGVVRWMQKSCSNSLHIGVEIFSPSGKAVVTKYASEASPLAHEYKGILLPELTTSGQTASLIVPITSFKLGDIIWMEEGTMKQQVRLTQIVESTGAFARFQFVPLTKESELMDEPDMDTDFDSIWSTL